MNTIQSVGEVSLRYIKTGMRLFEISISNSQDAYEIFKHIFDPETINHREQMYALYLSRNNQVLGYALISSGGLTSTVCDPRIVFQTALQLNAVGIILAHHHPSGNLEPSAADIALTKKIASGAKLMDLVLLDHLVITEVKYISLADSGML